MSLLSIAVQQIQLPSWFGMVSGDKSSAEERYAEAIHGVLKGAPKMLNWEEINEATGLSRTQIKVGLGELDMRGLVTSEWVRFKSGRNLKVWGLK